MRNLNSLRAGKFKSGYPLGFFNIRSVEIIKKGR